MSNQTAKIRPQNLYDSIVAEMNEKKRLSLSYYLIPSYDRSRDQRKDIGTNMPPEPNSFIPFISLEFLAHLHYVLFACEEKKDKSPDELVKQAPEKIQSFYQHLLAD